MQSPNLAIVGSTANVLTALIHITAAVTKAGRAKSVKKASFLLLHLQCCFWDQKMGSENLF